MLELSQGRERGVCVLGVRQGESTYLEMAFLTLREVLGLRVPCGDDA